MMKKFYIFCLLMAGAGTELIAQTINTTIDRNSILIGERLNYKLSVSLPGSDYRVSISVPDSIPHFEVLNRVGQIVKDKQNNYAWETKLILTSFDSGKYTIPSFPFKILRANYASQVLNTDSFSINVGYMPLDKSGQPRDIRTIINVDYFDWFWIYIGAGILALLIILFFLIRYLRRRKPMQTVKIDPNAYETALSSLDDLKRANAAGQTDVKEFYTRLIGILKQYYAKRAGTQLDTSTSKEILQKLHQYELKAETEGQAAKALEKGDAVKFAKYRASFTENEEAINDVRNVILETETTLTKKASN